ncbi:MAG: hypothetical protein HWE20_12960 [Gammaproteobacteria bacterium]|nr:hypothetical protein [Gammaproteobacteria bacterium]
MSDILIYWPNHQTDKVSWTNTKNTSAERIGTGSLQDAAAFCGRQKATLILSDRYCSVHMVELPPISYAKAKQAAPFALEELLAADIDDVHIAVGKPQGKLYPCAVVDREIIQSVQKRVQQAGINCKTITIDSLCLPTPNAVLQFEDGAIIRSPQMVSFVPKTMAATLIRRAFADVDPADIRAMTITPPPSDDALSWQTHDHPLQVLSPTHSPDGCNLYFVDQQATQDVSKQLKPWFRPLWLVAACAVVFVAARWVETQAVKKSLADLRAQQSAVYMQVFPESKGRAIADPARNMRAKLKALESNGGQSQSGLIDALAPLSNALSADNVELGGIYYRQGRMELNVTTDSLQAMDLLKNKLEELSGSAASLQAVTEVEGKTQARIRLEARS